MLVDCGVAEKRGIEEQVVNVLEIYGQNRKRDTLYMRYVFWEYFRAKKMTVTKLGYLTGHDHSTVTKGLKMVKEPQMQKYFEPYRKRIIGVIKKLEDESRQFCFPF